MVAHICHTSKWGTVKFECTWPNKRDKRLTWRRREIEYKPDRFDVQGGIKFSNKAAVSKNHYVCSPKSFRKKALTLQLLAQKISLAQKMELKTKFVLHFGTSFYFLRCCPLILNALSVNYVTYYLCTCCHMPLALPFFLSLAIFMDSVSVCLTDQQLLCTTLLFVIILF